MKHFNDKVQQYLLQCLCIFVYIITTGSAINAQKLIGEFDYYLPKVLLTIKPISEDVVIKPGRFFNKTLFLNLVKEGSIMMPYIKYVDKIDTAQRENGVVHIYSLKEIDVTPFSIADTSKHGYLPIRKRWNKQYSVNTELTEGGMLKSVSAQSEDQTFKILSNIVGAVVKVAGAVLGKVAAPGIPDTKVYLDTKSDFQRIWKEIQNIDNKIENGYINTSIQLHPEIYKQELSMLQQKRQDLLSLITYTFTKNTSTATFDIDPKENETVAVFYFNGTNGITLNPETVINSYNAYYNEDVEVETGRLPESSTIYITTIPKVISKSNRATLTPSAYLYNVPAYTNLIFTQGKSKSARVGAANFYIPQFGSVATMPIKANKLDFKIDPTTGALLSFGITNTPGAAGNLETGGDVLSNAVKTFKSKSELEKLTEKRQVLEEKKKIKDLEKEVEN